MYELSFRNRPGVLTQFLYVWPSATIYDNNAVELKFHFVYCLVKKKFVWDILESDQGQRRYGVDIHYVHVTYDLPAMTLSLDWDD